jgi:hypothetical protein
MQCGTDRGWIHAKSRGPRPRVAGQWDKLHPALPYDFTHRSHLKFDWPIQFTFALPRWPQHQLVLLNDHQSGGHIFDEGGVNSVGLAYRYEF